MLADKLIDAELTVIAMRGSAYNVKQLVSFLRPMAKVNSDGLVTFDFLHGQDGKEIVVQLTLDTVIPFMRDNMDQYGGFLSMDPSLKCTICRTICYHVDWDARFYRCQCGHQGRFRIYWHGAAVN